MFLVSIRNSLGVYIFVLPNFDFWAQGRGPKREKIDKMTLKVNLWGASSGPLGVLHL